jgi:hypothetical protein
MSPRPSIVPHKGIHTRERQPKTAADYLKRRWQKVCSAKCKPSAVP